MDRDRDRETQTETEAENTHMWLCSVPSNVFLMLFFSLKQSAHIEGRFDENNATPLS